MTGKRMLATDNIPALTFNEIFYLQAKSGILELLLEGAAPGIFHPVLTSQDQGMIPFKSNRFTTDILDAMPYPLITVSHCYGNIKSQSVLNKWSFLKFG